MKATRNYSSVASLVCVWDDVNDAKPVVLKLISIRYCTSLRVSVSES
jgi:hypothetical protein